MNKKKDLTAEETFALAVENQKKNNFQIAENLYKEILKTNPNHFKSIFYLGTLLAQTKKFNLAKLFLYKAIQIQPNYATAYNNLGNVLKELGENQKAKKSYEKAIQIQPNYADAHYNLGVVLKALGENQKAIRSYEKAIQIQPNYADAHYNLGVALKELGENQKAIRSYEKAIQIQPNYADAHYNLGNELKELGENQKAIRSYEKAIQIQPNYATAYNNLGNVLKELGENQKAKKSYEKAIQIQPNDPDVNFNFGMLLLSMSDFKNGLIQYEWRKILPQNINKYKNIKGLEWQGENLNNKTILILSEQGIGDIIQFSRYIYLIEKEYSVNIIFKTGKRIAYLFSKSKFKIIVNEDSIPKYDFYKHLMSLPKIYYEKTKTFPSQINFIPKDKKIALKWKERLNEIKGFKVGINWQGSKLYKSDHLRSIPLNYFNDLFNIEKINFISLQKGFGLEQIKNFKHKDKLYDFSKEVDNGENIFEDTIGILQNIDLVISIDSALVHLSSTLGIKTLALLHFCPDWRWNLITKEFSWYDNLKIYRQEEINKWDSIFSLLKKDLVAYKQRKRG
ncbi:tetratricopeptide repeat protein [Candidatus Pelagibacter sp.]|nr:tetratricopeptide repeat protein [Candidatus Pelagibacter sp.]